jgi:hypothetical protein
MPKMGMMIRAIDKKNFHWSETRNFFTGILLENKKYHRVAVISRLSKSDRANYYPIFLNASIP